jgi:hypothetical protein
MRTIKTFLYKTKTKNPYKPNNLLIIMKKMKIMHLFLFIALLSISLTTAQTDIFQKSWEELTLDKPLIMKIFIFLAVFFITSTALSYSSLFNKNKAITLVISITSGLLAGRYVPQNLAQPILQPYGLLGFLLLGVMPLLILFLFVRKFKLHPLLKKLFFILFGLYLASLATFYYFQQDFNLHPIIFWLYILESLISIIIGLSYRKIDSYIWNSNLNDKLSEIKSNQEFQKKKAQKEAEINRILNGN